jgi:predicted nucleic acid-binding protein
MYVDSAYIAKFYVNEADSRAVRELLNGAASICSSTWALVEVTSVFHRHVREGALTLAQGRELMDAFRSHADGGVWSLIPVGNALVRRAAAMIQTLPGKVPLRAGDVIHLATALDAGESEIWTNDRQLLAAAAHFGLAGRSV